MTQSKQINIAYKTYVDMDVTVYSLSNGAMDCTPDPNLAEYTYAEEWTTRLMNRTDELVQGSMVADQETLKHLVDMLEKTIRYCTN